TLGIQLVIAETSLRQTRGLFERGWQCRCVMHRDHADAATARCGLDQQWKPGAGSLVALLLGRAMEDAAAAAHRHAVLRHQCSSPGFMSHRLDPLRRRTNE